jgi:hypothetical protein
MSKVVVTDIIIPEVFEDYVIERTAVLTRFGDESGIIETDEEFDAIAQGGGQTEKMPFWKDLPTGRQLLSDSADLTVNKITTGQDICRIQNDANAWSANILTKWLSGSDPMGAIGDLVAKYWAREDELILLNSIKGVAASTSAGNTSPNVSFAAGNVLSIKSESVAGQSSASRLNGSTFVDALLKLGDRSNQLMAIAMHSATEGALRKADLIDFVPDSEGKSQIAVFQGRRVLVDDQMTTRDGTTDGTVYASVLFGPGAFGKGTARLNTPLDGGFGTEAVEFSRVSLASDSVLINRRRFILHPRGVKFNSASVAGDSPTNAELALLANWTIVYENKNVRMVVIYHNN